MWGATSESYGPQYNAKDFNPRTPMWGATPPLLAVNPMGW